MKRELVSALVWGGGIVVIALVLTWARQRGLVDGDTVTRVVIGLNGLMIAWYGNRMPKAFLPDAVARQVTRVGGWAMALSGLIYAALWAFAPIPVAIAGGCAAVLAGMAVTVAYCLGLRAGTKSAV